MITKAKVHSLIVIHLGRLSLVIALFSSGLLVRGHFLRHQDLAHGKPLLAIGPTAGAVPVVEFTFKSQELIPVLVDCDHVPRVQLAKIETLPATVRLRSSTELRAVDPNAFAGLRGKDRHHVRHGRPGLSGRDLRLDSWGPECDFYGVGGDPRVHGVWMADRSLRTTTPGGHSVFQSDCQVED